MSRYATPSERTARLMKLYNLRAAIETEIGRIESEINTEAALFAAARKSGIKRGRKVAECGTDSGYYRHHRTDKTAPCEPCRVAHNLAERLRVERARKAAEEMAKEEAA